MHDTHIAHAMMQQSILHSVNTVRGVLYRNLAGTEMSSKNIKEMPIVVDAIPPAVGTITHRFVRPTAVLHHG